VTVDENEVQGFQCNSTTGELQICIEPFNESARSLKAFLNDHQSIQHALSMVEIQNDVVSSYVQKLVNLRVVVNYSSAKRDKAFVALIPSKSTIYCIRGDRLYCRENDVIPGSATNYIFMRTDHTALETAECSLATTLSHSLSAASSPSDPTSSMPMFSAQEPSVTLSSVDPQPTSFSMIASSQPASVSSNSLSTSLPTPKAPQEPTKPSVSAVVQSLAGSLGPYSLISSGVITLLAVYIVYQRCKRRTGHQTQQGECYSQPGYNLPGPPSASLELQNGHTAASNTLLSDENS
jgi:hypothetical protein